MALLLEGVVPVGIGGETSARPDLTEDDVHLPLTAAFHSDRILNPLQPAHPWALYSGLNVVRREHGRVRRRTVHLELRPLQGRLRRTPLPLGEQLILRGAAGG